MKKPATRNLVAVLATLFAGSSLITAADKPSVYVPVLPYQWLFERVGGDWIEVDAIVGVGDDPHEYSPSPKQLSRIAQSNLIFSGELEFEANFLVKVNAGEGTPQQYSLLEGLDLLEGSCHLCDHGHGEDEHGHGEEVAHKEAEKHDEHEHEHEHGELKDPHVWLSPRMLSEQARRVASILKEHTPAEADAEIDSNLARLEQELKAVDEELTELLEPHKGEMFYVYHGAFAYFAQAYGLEQKAVEINGKRPSPRQIAELASQAKEDGVRTIFVQPQFDQSSAVSLADTIGGEVAPLDPLDADVIGNLRKIADAIRTSRG